MGETAKLTWSYQVPRMAVKTITLERNILNHREENRPSMAKTAAINRQTVVIKNPCEGVL